VSGPVIKPVGEILVGAEQYKVVGTRLAANRRRANAFGSIAVFIGFAQILMACPMANTWSGLRYLVVGSARAGG